MVSSGIGIVANAGPDTHQLVRRNTRPDRAATEHNRAVGLAALHGLTGGNDEIRIIIRRVERESAEIDNRMTFALKVIDNRLLERKSAVIGPN